MLQVAVNKQCDIIANISVDDGLLNGAHCSIRCIQHNNSKVSVPSIIWVQFEDPDVDKQRQR